MRGVGRLDLPGGQGAPAPMACRRRDPAPSSPRSRCLGICHKVAKGFGSRLAEKAIVQQFSGTLDYEWQPAGLAVTIVMPLESLSA